ncbi:MAG: MATE family efflux transporter [Lachnospiraceae bacterium]
MRQVDYRNGKIISNVMQSMLPMLVAQVLSLLYSIVDRIYIGRIPGEGTSALGGVGLCFPIIIMVTAFTNLFGLGGAPLCSIARGKGDLRRASEVMNTAFSMLVLTGVVITAAGELFAAPLLRLFGATDGNLPHALAYLHIYLLGTIFTMLATGLNPYINAQGFASTGMFTVVIGAVTNILLDPLFIFVFGLGVRGAALATVLSQILSAVFVLRFLTGDKAELRLTPIKDLQELPAELAGNDPDDRFRSTALDIAGLGAAAFVMQFTNSLVSIVCNSTLSKYGEEVMISVYTIINSVRQVLETPVIAIGEGTSPVISYNYGARRPGHVRKAMLLMGCLGIGYTLIVWILIERFPAFFISMFSTDAALMKDAIPALHLYFFAFVFQSLQYTGQTTFKALGKKKQAIFFSLFRKVVMVVPLTLLLPGVFHFGSDGVFMAEPVSNVIGGTACMVTMLLMVLPELRKME